MHYQLKFEIRTNKEKIMTKFTRLIVVCGTIVLTLLSVSCKKAASSEKKSIVCTTFPAYDWVMNILGEKTSNFDVTQNLKSFLQECS